LFPHLVPSSPGIQFSTLFTGLIRMGLLVNARRTGA
jgi:hypothetical protein